MNAQKNSVRGICSQRQTILCVLLLPLWFVCWWYRICQNNKSFIQINWDDPTDICTFTALVSRVSYPRIWNETQFSPVAVGIRSRLYSLMSHSSCPLKADSKIVHLICWEWLLATSSFLHSVLICPLFHNQHALYHDIGFLAWLESSFCSSLVHQDPSVLNNWPNVDTIGRSRPTSQSSVG